MNNVSKIIGLTIREIRNEKRISQEEFSQITGVHRTYISPLENGLKNPSIGTLKRMLDRLDISLSDFFQKAKL